MLFGNKKTFCVEVDINNCFHDDFVGEGKFIIYIKNVAYGLDEPYATTFYCIKDELLQFSKNLINSNLQFDQFSALEIAEAYYLQNYSDANLLELKKELLSITKNLVTWSPESAFDDGSYLIQIDNNNFTRLIAFKSVLQSGKATVNKESVNEIIIQRTIFEQTLNKALVYLSGL